MRPPGPSAYRAWLDRQAAHQRLILEQRQHGHGQDPQDADEPGEPRVEEHPHADEEGDRGE